MGEVGCGKLSDVLNCRRSQADGYKQPISSAAQVRKLIGVGGLNTIIVTCGTEGLAGAEPVSLRKPVQEQRNGKTKLLDEDGSCDNGPGDRGIGFPVERLRPGSSQHAFGRSADDDAKPFVSAGFRVLP